MTSEQIAELVNHFVKLVGKFDLSKEDLANYRIALIHGQDFWDLKIERGKKPKDAALWLEFPEWDGKDKLDLQINLAGFLSRRINGYFAKVKANQSRSPEQRLKSAQKAIATRWNKS